MVYGGFNDFNGVFFTGLIHRYISVQKNQPQIHVSAKKENKQYVFSVKDNRIGKGGGNYHPSK